LPEGTRSAMDSDQRSQWPIGIWQSSWPSRYAPGLCDPAAEPVAEAGSGVERREPAASVCGWSFEAERPEQSLWREERTQERLRRERSYCRQVRGALANTGSSSLGPAGRETGRAISRPGSTERRGRVCGWSYQGGATGAVPPLAIAVGGSAQGAGPRRQVGDVGLQS
jgi:hypothetical protein